MSERWDIHDLSRTEKLILLKYILNNSRRKSSGCLSCYIGLDKDGYSTIRIGGKYPKNYRTHRVIMYLLIDFDLNSSLQILHNDSICLSKACIEFNHLRIGTHKENMYDSYKKHGPMRKKKDVINHV